VELKDMVLPKKLVLTLVDDEDQPHSLTLGIINANVLAAIQRKYGVLLTDPAKGPTELSGLGVFLSKLDSIEDLRFITWQLLQRHHPELTEDQVGTFITLANFQQVFQAVLQMLTTSLPNFSEEKKKEMVLGLQKEMAKAGTGIPSSPASSETSTGPLTTSA
jgi:hypothetical protein